MDTLRAMLSGAVAMSAFLLALFFLRFWLRTRDRFFLLFSIAFAIYAITQLVVPRTSGVPEFEPLYYLPRVVTFSLIMLAVVEKNRKGRP
jgi:uncharacterized membrane protein